MELSKEKILAEKLLRIEGLGYDEALREYTKAIREYREEIETDFRSRDKEYTRIDERLTLRTLDKRDDKVQREREVTILDRTQREFDDPTKIAEL